MCGKKKCGFIYYIYIYIVLKALDNFISLLEHTSHFINAISTWKFYGHL